MNEQLKEEIVKILLDTIEENVKLIRGKNTIYPNASLFTCMIWAGINRISIDEATEQLDGLGYNVLPQITCYITFQINHMNCLNLAFKKSYNLL